MLDIKQVRKDPQFIAEALQKKRYEFPLDEFVRLDSQRKEACASGRYAAAGQTECDACPAGKFQEAPGQAACDRCDAAASFCAANSSAQQAVKYNPDDFLAHTSLSIFYQRKGMIQEAEEEKAIAARLQPDNPV